MEWFSHLILEALLGSILLGLNWARQILREEPKTPPWIEALAPLKGRWLWLLLSTPMLLFGVWMMFLGLLLPLTFVGMVASVLWGESGLLGTLILGGTGLIFYCLKKTVLTADRHPSRGA